MGRDDFLTACRMVYRQIAGDHPDWDEYDATMLDEHRTVVIVVPDRVYGAAI